MMLASVIKRPLGCTDRGNLRQERASLAKIILHVGGIETLGPGCSVQESLSSSTANCMWWGIHQMEGLQVGQDLGARAILSSPTHTSRLLPLATSSQNPQQPSPAEPAQYSLGQAWKAVSAQPCPSNTG